MNCLSNMCYVCLEKKDKSLIKINSSLAVNKDIIHIIGYVPFNLGWMKTKPIILICEECCRRLRETYQFLIMCHKNSAVLQGYMAKINTANITDAANDPELREEINNKQDDINEATCEIKVEDEEIYTVEKGPIIGETEYEFVNVEDSFVKEEDTWKIEQLDDKEEPPMLNNSTERSDSDADTEIAGNSNTHDTDTDSDSSGFTFTHVHTTNNKDLNTAAKKLHKCLTCSKSFSWKSQLHTHARIHTAEKHHKCSVCEKCFSTNVDLVRHMRLHTGEKPYKCSRCAKSFSQQSNLVRHMRTHTGEKPYECVTCKKCFSERIHLVRHMPVHTGEKPFKCTICEKCFPRQSNLVRHMFTHTGEKTNK